MKSAEKEYTGNQTVTDGVEMAGWGVEEAEAQNRKDASKLHLFLTLSCLYMLCYDILRKHANKEKVWELALH